jgi:hypothetical protein
MDAPPRPALRLRLLVVLPLLAFVAATTHWMPWQEPIRAHFAGDVDDYEKIARAAPHFTWPEIEGHVAMWPMHYLIGITSKATDIPLHVVYYAFAFLVLAAIVVIVDRLLGELRVDLPVYALCMGALLLNPYIFRYLALAPGMINDTVFIAALCFTTLGLLRRRLGWVICGLTAAALSRGLSVPPALVGAAAWIAFGPWPGRAWSRPRISAAVYTVLVPTAALAVAYWAGAKAPGHAPAFKNCCSISDLTIWGDLRGLPGSVGTFGTHLVRIFLGLAMPLALFVAGSILALRNNRRIPTTAWAAFGLGALMVAQPLLLASAWDAGAEPRLTSLASGPMLAALALLLGALDLQLDWVDVGVLLAIFAVASLSHRFANVGPHTPGQFAGLVLFCAAAAVAWLLGGSTVRRRARWAGTSAPGTPRP